MLLLFYPSARRLTDLYDTLFYLRLLLLHYHYYVLNLDIMHYLALECTLMITDLYEILFYFYDYYNIITTPSLLCIDIIMHYYLAFALATSRI